MALVVKDRVRETSVTQGTGTFTLAGAVTGYQSFTAIGNGNTTYYTIYLQASNEWEVGIGTYTASGTTLSRDTILASSNGGAVVNFSAGTKDVFVTYPAGRSVYYDTATNVTVNQLSATTVDATNVEVTNIKAKDGTAALSIADSTGVVSVSANPVLSGGTANGVAYLNGSKVLTTGSALTFDGTNLGLGTASPSGAAGTTFAINGGAGQTRLALKNNASGDASSDGFQIALLSDGINVVYQNRESGYQSWELAGSEQMRLTSTGLKSSIAGTNANPVFSYTSDTNTGIFFPAADKLGFVAGGGADQMVLTSTGLGIGTSSLSYTSAGRGNVNIAGSSGAILGFQIGGVAKGYVFHDSTLLQLWNETGGIILGTAGATRATLDSSGNLGLGVTPSAWRTDFSTRAIQVGLVGSLSSLQASTTNNQTFVSSNTFLGVSDWVYLYSDAASKYRQYAGQHSWFTAASGTANTTTITNGVSYTIITSGNQTAFGAANNNVGTQFTATSSGTLSSGTVSQNISFTQAMTLDASGNLGIGQTNPSTWLVNGLGIGSGANDWGATIYTGTANTGYLCFADGATGLDRYRGYISYAHATNAMIFATDAAERMRIDASGRLFVGNTTAPGSGEIKQVLSRAGNTFLEFQNSTTNTGCTIGTINENFIIFTNTGALGSETYTERARITSGGYFKASNDGTYFNSTGTYHELRQTANAQVVTVSATNASFTSESIFSTATKTAGTDWMHFYGTSDGNTVANIRIFGNGNVQNANNSYAGISDQKLKQDIVDAGSQWDDIKNLQVRKYRFKASPNAPLQIGLVAQEAETVSPGLVEETVDRDSEGNDLGTTTKAVKYSVLYMKAIKALQEAMARIEKLEAEVAALKGA